jgi:hypothetical protein
MTIARSDEIARNMRQKTTVELLDIWTNNDRGQWSDIAFDAISVPLAERGVDIPLQGVFVPPPPRYKGVRGWLLLLCISLTVFNPLSIVASLGAVSTSDMFHDFWPAFMTYEILSFIFAGFFIYVGACLWRVRPGAVKKAKVFLWCVVALNAILVLWTRMAGLPSHDERGRAIGGIFGALVWIAYLESSKRVAATYDL